MSWVAPLAKIFFVSITPKSLGSYIAAKIIFGAWNAALGSFLIGKISGSIFSPPPGARTLRGPSPTFRAAAAGGSLELFDGFRARSSKRWSVGSGDCLEPAYPGGRTLMCVDSTLPVRSGDLAEVLYTYPSKWRAGRFVETQQPQHAVKLTEQLADGRWILHSANEEPFLLDGTMRFTGRVTAALVLPEGIELGGKLTALGLLAVTVALVRLLPAALREAHRRHAPDEQAA